MATSAIASASVDTECREKGLDDIADANRQELQSIKKKLSDNKAVNVDELF